MTWYKVTFEHTMFVHESCAYSAKDAAKLAELTLRSSGEKVADADVVIVEEVTNKPGEAHN